MPTREPHIDAQKLLQESGDKDTATIVNLLLEILSNRPECRLHNDFNAAIVRLETKVEEGFKTIFNRLTMLEGHKNGFIEHRGAERIKDQVAVWIIRIASGIALLIAGGFIGHIITGG